MAKIKTQIALTKPQFDYLSAEANKSGNTLAELVRRVLDQHIARNSAN